MLIKEQLTGSGFYVDYEYVKPDKIGNFNEFFKLQESRPGVVEFKIEDIKKTHNETLQELYTSISSLMKQVNSNLQFHKLWFQTTNKFSSQAFEAKASPFLPHIDTQRYIKAMLYVTDVGIHDGPFTTSKLNPNFFEELRGNIVRKITSEMNYQQERPEFNLERQTFTPITGKKGMLIVFDTNTPHFAGRMESENVRKILRFDFWDKRHA